MDSYFVTGCGVSVICDSKDSVLAWVMEMIERGGAPTVEKIDILTPVR